MPRKQRPEPVLYARLKEDISKWIGTEQLRTGQFQSAIIHEALVAAMENRPYKLEEKVFKTDERLKEAIVRRKKRAKRRT